LAPADDESEPTVAPPCVLVRDVTATPAEFDASLRQAGGGHVDGALPLYTIADGDVRLEVEVAAGPERRLGRIRLATLIVTYRFTAGRPAAQRALLARLDRAMHRGGG
jgi:hypothetical protein